LEVLNRIGTATVERDDVILPIAGACTDRVTGRRTGVLALELACSGMQNASVVTTIRFAIGIIAWQ